MTAYNAPADIPVVSSQKWTGRWLRGEAEFQGLVVTDWTEIYNQIDWHRTAATPLEAITQALTRASLDMVLYRRPPLRSLGPSVRASVVLLGTAHQMHTTATHVAM